MKKMSDKEIMRRFAEDEYNLWAAEIAVDVLIGRAHVYTHKDITPLLKKIVKLKARVGNNE